MDKKQVLKENILALARGEKAPQDIYPKCVMKIGYGEGNIYMVNEKEVSEEQYKKATANLDCDAFTITYGGKE